MASQAEISDYITLEQNSKEYRDWPQEVNRLCEEKKVD